MNRGDRVPEREHRMRFAVLAALGSALTLPGLAAVAQAAPPVPTAAVIIRGATPACGTSLDDEVRRLGGTHVRTLDILNGVSATVTLDAVRTIAMDGCAAAITPDSEVMHPESIGGYDPTADAGSLYNTEQIIGAQQAWSQGFTGHGVGIAIIDTGIAPVEGLNAPGQVTSGVDVSFASQVSSLSNNDEFGHGTAIAAIAAGNDIWSKSQPSPPPGAKPGWQYVGDTTHFLGVAPDANLVQVKVGDENGVADVSQMIAAIDWVVQHKDDNGMHIRVINLSYGTLSGQSYVLDPLAYAVEQAYLQHITVVAAAGNQGGSSNGLSDPAFDPFVLAVGAADTQGSVHRSSDTVASFSSVGDGVRNPDVVAPGVHIETLRDPGSVIDQQFGSTATIGGGRFFLGSGTSEAAAVVSGAAALYIQAKGDNPDQVKAALMESATPLAGQPAIAQGSGEINIANAIKGNYTALAQHYTLSTGLGTLEAARGGVHVVAANGTALSGETDAMGNAWNAASMARAEKAHNTWNNGGFNGAAWAGNGWNANHSAWLSTSWAGTGWSGTAWSGTAWSGSTWNGTGWSGTGWSGTAWSGTGWSGAAWSGAGWSGAGWSDYSWS